MHCFHQLMTKSAYCWKRIRVAKHLASVSLNDKSQWCTMKLVSELHKLTCITYCQGAKVQGKPKYLQHFQLFCES